MPLEYDCPDCGRHVVSYDGSTDTTHGPARRCLECATVAAIEDPVAREMARRALRLDPPPPAMTKGAGAEKA